METILDPNKGHALRLPSYANLQGCTEGPIRRGYSSGRADTARRTRHEIGGRSWRDCAWEQYRQAAAHADDDSSGADKKGERKSRQLARETTKKLLGGVAKKTDAAVPNNVKRQQQSRNK